MLLDLKPCCQLQSNLCASRGYCVNTKSQLNLLTAFKNQGRQHHYTHSHCMIPGYNRGGINLDDPSIDWANALPPHIAAQQRAEREEQERASALHQARTRGMMFNFPLPEGELEQQRQHMLARQQRMERGRAQVEEAWGNALGTGRHDARESPQPARDGRATGGRAPPLPRQQQSNTNVPIAVSRRELLAQREQETYHAWAHGTPANTNRQQRVAGLEEEIEGERTRVREAMIDRINARQGVAQRRQVQEERALRDQQERTQNAMRQRVAQNAEARSHHPPQHLPETSSAANHTPHRNNHSSMAELVAAQLRMEEEERMILSQAPHLYTSPSLATPPPSAIRQGGGPSSPPPPWLGSHDELLRMQDAHTFSPQGGGVELQARGMSRRAAGTTLAQQRRGVGVSSSMNIFGVSQPLPVEALRQPSGGPSANGGGGGRGGGGNGEWEIGDFSYEALLELGSMAVSTGLDKRQLERYKPVVLSRANQHQLLSASGRNVGGTVGDTDDCSICLEPLQEGERVLTIQCKHLFHYPCIIQWLARTNKCPVCRFEIPRKEKIVH